MKFLLIVLSALVVIFPQAQGAVPASPPGVITSVFGKLPSGKPVTLYTLTNKQGASVSIMDYGATIVNLQMPNRRGKLDDVVLGFDTLAPYLTNTPYFGATVGRYANRIARGQFTLDGKVYHLPINNAPNSLHGGKIGFNKKMWTAKIVSQHPAAVSFSLVSPHKDQGYPGALNVSVSFILNDQNALIVLYGASTDRPTVLNLTNHSYFNLAGTGNGNVLNHRIKINAFYYTPTDAHLIPTGEIRSVIGTPFDLRKFTPIGAAIQQTGGNPIGYDHNYVLARAGSKKFALAAEVYEPTSGRFLKVLTDQPGLQFYTANFLNGTLQGKGGQKYPQYGAFCLETQHFPDSPNHPNFPSTVLRPGEIFRSATVYKFGVR
ncbi:MAG: galactose-1-epimerase [Verrucomicrobia bacterium]|nr:MAG: galactose-1-epimerase [Verrucomicrobiota bacterium]